MPKQKLLKVLANPYASDVDSEGRLHAHLQYEPNVVSGDASLRWVGCRVVATKRDGEARQYPVLSKSFDDYDHAWVYDTSPVSVPPSAYYLMAIRHGDLLVADLESYKVAYGGAHGFVDPYLRLAQYAAERGVIPEPAKDWEAILGVPKETPTEPASPMAKAKTLLESGNGAA